MNLLDWIKLGRPQSIPVTFIPLLLGYGSVTASVFKPDVALILIGAFLGHWGVFANNEIVDYEYDKRANKIEKPLVSGEIELTPALIAHLVVILWSAYFFFLVSLNAVFMWGVCIFLGIWYNRVSKDEMLSPVLMLFWGINVVWTGAIAAGDINMNTVFISIFMGMYMFIAIITGEMKDLGNGEVSIAEWGMTLSEGAERVYTRFSMKLMFNLFQWIMVFPVMMITVGSGTYREVITIIGGIAVVVFGDHFVKAEREFDTSFIKVEMVFYAIIVSILGLFASTAFMDHWEVAAITVASIVWGLGWQRVLFGDPFWFP